ncbi:(Fe-S)-binding protein [Streptomyces sp. BH106]|uniref:(Fe-S)-binding protein n=1 Tax=Streptomyces sp. BH106 TaxID=3410409 RepID=UPI003CF247DF
MIVDAATKSRTVMWGMSTGLTVLFFVLSAISIVVFIYGVVAPILRYRRGNSVGLPPWRELPGRVVRAAKLMVTHETIARRNRVVGWAHRAIVYGWATLFAGTVIVALDHDILQPLFGVRIFQGNFYLACKTALNILGTGLIAGMVVMMWRRAVTKPPALDYTRPDRAADEPGADRTKYLVGDWVFVVSLLVIAVTGFVLQGVRMAMEDPGYSLVQFGGWVFAEPLGALLNHDQLGVLRHGIWWFHGVLSLAFVAAIPYTKASHMLVSFVSLVLRDPEAKRQLRAVPEDANDKPVGYATLEDFSALHLLQLDSCTKCGRCHEVCPATSTGRPLSPRDVVLELRDELHEALPPIGGVLGGLMRGEGNVVDLGLPVVGHDNVREESVWACMQCNACVDICPVGVEQAPIINGMRRALVDQGDIAPTLQTAFEAIEKTGNSFGREARTRASWTKDLGFTVKDARTEPVDVLWFVGDYASFDERSQEITKATARLFHAAGLDFGILYDGEYNSGNDVRRAGEEGLFESLAERNIAALRAASFQRIVTTDPHSLNALRNDYPTVGGDDWEVVHHAQQLVELIEDGRLAVGTLDYRVTYHDPCNLGRMNGDFEAPRRILELLGCTLVEMPRNRSNSFCCGAGGGRIWMPDPAGTEKPSENRIHEAVALEDVDYFIVTCPKDVTMYEDAIRTTGSTERLTLRELTELIEESHARTGRAVVTA